MTMRIRFFPLLTAVFCAAQAVAAMAARVAPIQSVKVTPAVIHAASGESAAIDVTLSEPGTLDVLIVDRDGFAVRRLASARRSPLANRFVWDGRAENGEIVPDEAYSLKIDWSSGKRRHSYFPAEAEGRMTGIRPLYFSSRNATLVYELPQASRVHVQAGTSVPDGRGDDEGPVMKTLVNREPRAGGRVVEYWTGMDEGGTVYVPDLPNFVFAIAVVPLPESSIITNGNRSRTFLEHASLRKGTSLLRRRTGDHRHHAGLTALDDVSPPMQLEPLNATWSPAERIWTTDATELAVRVSVTGPAAESFARQPGKLHRFVNSRLVATTVAAGQGVTVRIPLQRKRGGDLVSLNWQSDFGGVAANTLRVRAGGGSK